MRAAGYNNLMKVVSIEEIQQDLPRYLRSVEEGETLVITRADQPVAEIKPIGHGTKQLRPFGLCAGQFSVPEDFDDPPGSYDARISSRARS
jgi:antitoxin (DNA-binding transcriptional repressor) of toxin-antitoxin stability system